MKDTLKGSIKKLFHSFGYDITAKDTKRRGKRPLKYPSDFDEATREVFESVRPFTMTSKERVFALCRSVEYIVRNDVPGDIVECGVWKGGSMMAVAKVLNRLGVTKRLHLFDTYEGMTEPTDVDQDFRGTLAADRWAEERKSEDEAWACSHLDEVQHNLASTGYNKDQFFFVKGSVEKTIPGYAPESISLLRLDTDWYESTYHELVHLFPRLSVGGVLLIDDYGHWQGARKAVDQYIEENQLKLLLNRIDYTGRICVKLEP